MGILDGIEKLITEHGSAAILREQLELAKQQFSALERQVGDAISKIAKMEAMLELERLAHDKTKQELQQLRDEHSEEIRVHEGIEFRRGKRTAGKWAAFCPICHCPGDTSTGMVRCANSKCGWQPLLGEKQLEALIARL